LTEPNFDIGLQAYIKEHHYQEKTIRELAQIILNEKFNNTLKRVWLKELGMKYLIIPETIEKPEIIKQPEQEVQPEIKPEKQPQEIKPEIKQEVKIEATVTQKSIPENKLQLTDKEKQELEKRQTPSKWHLGRRKEHH